MPDDGGQRDESVDRAVGTMVAYAMAAAFLGGVGIGAGVLWIIDLLNP